MAGQKSKRADWFMICAEHKTGCTGKPEHGWRCVPSEIARIKREKLANGFRLWIDPTEKDIEQCLSGGDGLMVDFWLHMPRAQDFADKHSLPLAEYVDRTVEMLLGYMKKYGNRVWWTLYGEHDNHIARGRPPKKSASRKESYEYMKAVMTTSKCVTDKIKFPGAGGSLGLPRRGLYNGMPQPFEYLKRKGIDFEKANIAIQCGYGSFSHYLYQWGPKLLWMEFNCGSPNIQVELAFLRGGAVQYDKYWGIDISSWGGLVPFSTVYEKDGSYLTGTHPNLQLREMLTAFLTGANLIHQEQTELSFWVDKKLGAKIIWLGADYGRMNKYLTGIETIDPADYVSSADTEWFNLGQRELELSATGKVSQQVTDFAVRRHPEIRKHPYRPFGLLMEQYHGWVQDLAPFNQVCFGNNDYEAGDYQIKAFFSAAFPNHLGEAPYRGGIWGRGLMESQDVSAAQYDVRNLVSLVRKGFDVRPYASRDLVSSRWGDTFDVLTENADAETLSRYPMLVLLGRLLPGPKLEKRLLQYVENGGAVFASSENLSRRVLEKLGVAPQPQQRNCTVECLYCKSRFVHKSFQVRELSGKTGKIVARTDDHRPLVVEIPHGQGKFFVCTIPHGLLGDRTAIPEGIKHVLDHIFDAFLPVEIRGGPIQWLVNNPPGELVVTLINNSADIWNGRVVFKHGALEGVREIWTETAVEFQRDKGRLSVEVNLEPFGFRVLCAHDDKSRQS